tara:strand:- start:153 stop:455 length:303 start_codon:yes stop_codon:yes gene_type:complete
MIHNKDDTVFMHPEEKEYRRKKEQLRKFYTIDVRPGDIIRFVSGDKKYFGLVVETNETLDDRSDANIVSGKVQWSVDAPIGNETTDWHQFNTSMWSVMNR